MGGLSFRCHFFAAIAHTEMRPPVLRGRQPCRCLKYLQKMLIILKSCFITQFNHSVVRSFQKALCLIDTQFLYIAYKICSRILFKKMAEQGIVHGHLIAYYGHAQGFTKMRLHIPHSFTKLLFVSSPPTISPSRSWATPPLLPSLPTRCPPPCSGGCQSILAR